MWYQIVGWYGVIAILIAYASSTLELLMPHSLAYLGLNASGAIALIVQSYVIKNWQLVVLNVVWLLVAGVGLVQVLLQ